MIIEAFIKKIFEEKGEEVLKINKFETSGNFTYKIKTNQKDNLVENLSLNAENSTILFNGGL